MHCFYASSSGVRDDGLFEIGELDGEGYAEIEESDDMVMDEFLRSWVASCAWSTGMISVAAGCILLSARRNRKKL